MNSSPSRDKQKWLQEHVTDQKTHVNKLSAPHCADQFQSPPEQLFQNNPYFKASLACVENHKFKTTVIFP
jgi:hypothetical protein